MQFANIAWPYLHPSTWSICLSSSLCTFGFSCLRISIEDCITSNFAATSPI
uniref:Uncharacterized protein n=1 Tax=Arundo donax TaxID=35708 RepID=A0A0A9D1Z6_ARUDO